MDHRSSHYTRTTSSVTRTHSTALTTRAPGWTGTTCSAVGGGAGPRSASRTASRCWPAAGAAGAAAAAAVGAVAGGGPRSATRDGGDGRGGGGAPARARGRRGAWPGCDRCS